MLGENLEFVVATEGTTRREIYCIYRTIAQFSGNATWDLMHAKMLMIGKAQDFSIWKSITYRV